MNLLKVLKENKSKLMDIKKIPDKISKILLSIFIFATIFPGGSSKILVIGAFGLIMGLWLIKDKEKFVSFFIKPNLLMYSIYIWILVNLVFIVSGYAPILKGFLNNNIRIAFTSIIFVYLVKTNKISDLKWLVLFSISLIVITNFLTIIANYRQYNISRVLATGVYKTSSYFGVGSYAYIYGLMFFVITLIYLIMKSKDKKNKYIAIGLGIISLYTICKAEFVISLFLIILATILIIFKIDNIKKVLILLAIIVSVGLVFSPIIGHSFKILGDNVQQHNLKIRFNDLAEIFLNKSLNNTKDLKKRFDVYNDSLKLFLKSPLVGNGYNDYVELGQHSMILDELAKYGIIGNIPFIIMIYAISNSIMKSFESREQKNIFFICLLIFFVLALINNVMFVSVFYFLFTLSPAIIYIKVNDIKNDITEEKGIKEEKIKKFFNIMRKQK